MEWSAILDYAKTLAPWVQYVFVGLGSLVVIGTAVDSVIPDEKDGGFMKKVMAIPVLGSFLQAVAKFSPFNVRQ
jgi:amino acid permease